MQTPIAMTRRARALCRGPLAGLLLAALAACAAPPAESDSAADSDADSIAVASVPANSTATPVDAPRKSSPLPPEQVGTPTPANAPPRVDASCKVDADCAVKNVGNCCGAYPACVNVDSPTDPAAVQAACKASGRMAACGFREIKSCSCDQGTCRAQAEPVGGWIDGEQPAPVQ